MAAPKVGAIIDGYRFLGGDPNNQASWQPSGIDEIAAAKTAGAAEGKMQGRAAAPVNQNVFNEAANQLKDIKGIRNSASFLNTGFLGNMQAAHPDGQGKTGMFNSGIPGSPGYNLDKELGTVKSRLMLANMAKLKAASPTGATGMGALSNAEGDILKSTVAPLDIGLPASQLRQSLDRVREDVIINNPGVTLDKPIDLSQGQSRSTIPRGAFYRDPQGNIRRNDNGDQGNPIIRLAAGQAGQRPVNAFSPQAAQQPGRPPLEAIFGK